MTLGLFSSFGWLPRFRLMGALLMISLHTFFGITLVLMMRTGDFPGLIYAPSYRIFSLKPEQMSALSVSFMTVSQCSPGCR